MTDTANGFDLSSFGDGLLRAQEEGIEVDILNPKTGDPIGLTVKICGPDSDRSRRIRRQQIEERVRRRKPMSAVDLEADGLKIIAASVMSWNFKEGVTIDGKVPACTPSEIEAVLRRFPFIRDQLDVAAGDRAGFMKD